MEKSILIKKRLIPIICLVALGIELLPVGIFSMLVRGAAAVGCLFSLCAGKLKLKNVLISIAVMLIGVPSFGLFAGFIMEGAALMPAIFQFASCFVAFLIIFCVIKKESLESVGWVAVASPFAFAVAYGMLSVLPFVLNDLGNMGVIRELDYMCVAEKLALPKSVLFYGALAIVSVRCGRLSDRKENAEKQQF